MVVEEVVKSSRVSSATSRFRATLISFYLSRQECRSRSCEFIRFSPDEESLMLSQMMLDVTKGDSQRRLLELELEAVGIRLNTKAPDVVIRQKVSPLLCVSAQN